MRIQFSTLFLLCTILTAVGVIIPACSSATPGEEDGQVSTNGTDTQEKSTTTSNQPTDTLIPFTPSQTIVPSQTPGPSTTPTKSSTSTATSTLMPSQTSSPTLSPTYAILRGTVLEQANCRYGPGAAYLYKYGLYPGNNVEIIGRNDPGTWIVIQAIGGSNPCWVKASLLNIKGEVMSLAPASLPLPHSPFYGPLTGVNAQRSGDSVAISWSPLNLKAGDDSLQYPYLIEAWLCQDGEQKFNPIGSWENFVTVQDESGCSEPSHARVYGVEKHGYTNWVEIPWPQP
jgi:hypothetical protein